MTEQTKNRLLKDLRENMWLTEQQKRDVFAIVDELGLEYTDEEA